MFRTGNSQNDVERGQEGSEGIELMPWPATPVGSAQPQHEEHPSSSHTNGVEGLITQQNGVEGMNNRRDSSRSPQESHEQHQDFDDSANELWSLYGKEAKSHDEARIKTLKDDMDGVLIFAGLFSAVLTAFVVPKIQDLKVNPANLSLASVGSQTNLTPPLPYPTFHVSASDRRVNIFWVISLVFSLSAALLATLVQQWVRAYMRIFQQSSNPLKTARIRLYLFEGAERLPMVAEAVPGLIHISLILFFWGLGDIILQIDTAVFVATVVPIAICVCLYLCCVIAPIRNPQSPYRTPFSSIIWRLIRILHFYYNRPHGKVVKLASMEIRQEQSAMKGTEDRMKRDVRAVRWLVDKINGSNETQTFVLAIPGSFHQKWGRDVWEGVVRAYDSPSTVGSQTQLHPSLPSLRERTTVYDLCRCVQYFFKSYSNEGYSIDQKERRRRMHGCVEAAASLVCCTDVELGLFGEVGEVLGELGDKERTNDPLTIRSNPLFTVRWTCLSLVAIWKMIDGDRLQVLAKYALDGIARFQTDYGSPDSMALTAAERIDDYLKKAWAPVVDLNLAFEPWTQNRTESEIREILISREASILELERIAIEVDGVQDIDWRISLLQETMDEVTHKLTRRLPGVFFKELKSGPPIMISEAFDFPSVEATPVPPQLIFPGQQIQSLCSLGRRLRDIIQEQNTETHEQNTETQEQNTETPGQNTEGREQSTETHEQNTERQQETLKSLESLLKIPVALRQLNNLMKRQLWRLLDLRDGGSLGFTIELFFLAVRQLPSTSSSSELKEVFYTGTFKVITSNWEKSKKSAGTQRVLLDLLCDLIIRNRGVFSDFSYPTYLVDMLLDLVEKMVEGHSRGPHPHIDDVILELEDDSLWNRMDNSLRDRALNVIYKSASP